MEKFRVGTVTAHRRTETASWSLHWRIDGTRYRRTINTPDRMIAEEVAEAVWRAVQSRDFAAAEDALQAPFTAQLNFGDLLDAFEAECPASLGSYTPRARQSHTLQDITVGYDGWQTRTWRGNKAIRRRLRAEWGSLSIHSITSRKVARFLSDQEQISSASTRNHYLTTLSTIFKWAEQYRLLKEIPTREIRRKRCVEQVPEALTQEEIKALLKQLTEAEQRVFVFLQDTGLRISELTELRWQDVDLEHKLIIIRNNKGTGYFRSIPLTQRATEVLVTHGDNTGREDLVGLYAKSERYLRERLKLASARAKIRHVYPHILRHTFATELVDEGVPLETIQKLLGHKGINMTLRYAKKRGKGLKGAIDKLGR